MKKVMWIASFAAALSACNDGTREEGTHTGTDSAAHSARQDGTEGMGSGTTTIATDTAAMAGGSLLSIMQTNMDQLKGMPSTGDPDSDFASMMKMHHLGAMEMARMEVAQGTDAALKQMAQKMMDTQQKEIEGLNPYVTPKGNGGRAFHEQARSMMNQMRMDTSQTGGAIDKQFAQLMAGHHKSGIDLSDAYLKHGQEAGLKTLATKIKSGQQKELKELQAWQEKNKAR